MAFLPVKITDASQIIISSVHTLNSHIVESAMLSNISNISSRKRAILEGLWLTSTCTWTFDGQFLPSRNALTALFFPPQTTTTCGTGKNIGHVPSPAPQVTALHRKCSQPSKAQTPQTAGRTRKTRLKYEGRGLYAPKEATSKITIIKSGSCETPRGQAHDRLPIAQKSIVERGC